MNNETRDLPSNRRQTGRRLPAKTEETDRKAQRCSGQRPNVGGATEDTGGTIAFTLPVTSSPQTFRIKALACRGPGPSGASRGLRSGKDPLMAADWSGWTLWLNMIVQNFPELQPLRKTSKGFQTAVFDELTAARSYHVCVLHLPHPAVPSSPLGPYFIRPSLGCRSGAAAPPQARSSAFRP